MGQEGVRVPERARAYHLSNLGPTAVGGAFRRKPFSRIGDHGVGGEWHQGHADTFPLPPLAESERRPRCT